MKIQFDWKFFVDHKPDLERTIIICVSQIDNSLWFIGKYLGKSVNAIGQDSYEFKGVEFNLKILKIGKEQEYTLDLDLLNTITWDYFESNWPKHLEQRNIQEPNEFFEE